MIRAEEQINLVRVNDGDDGYSPTATVSKVGDTATITITDKNGTTSESISDGAAGTPAPTITDVKIQYYLSTSDSSAIGGTWADTPQAFVSGKYYWTREYTTYSNNTYTTSTPIYNQGLTMANEYALSANEAADNASEYAARALGNLASIQSVAETLAWITQHGTMTLTTDTALDPTHVYFISDASGDYHVGSNYYSIVTEPNIADIATYYELTIDESLQNYVGTHLVLDEEGLWLLPATTGTHKVLIATGNGSTYTSAGTYIVDNNGNTIAKYGSTSVIGKTNNAHIQLDSTSLQLINKEQEPFFIIEDMRDEDGYATITETVRVYRLGPPPTGIAGQWATFRVSPEVSTTFAIDELLSLSIGGNDISDLSQVTVTRWRSGNIYQIFATYSLAAPTPPDFPDFPDEPLLLSSSSSDDILDYFNTSTLTDGTIIFDDDPTVMLVSQSQGSIGLRKTDSREDGGAIALGNTLFNNYVTAPTGNVQIAYTDVVVSYKTSDSNANYLTFGSRTDVVKGKGSISLGMSNSVSGTNAIAAGYSLTVSGQGAFAEGFKNEATGQFAHAEGALTKAYGYRSHAEGNNTIANNNYAHSEGYSTGAVGIASHAEGTLTKARGHYSHAEGYDTVASGEASHSSGHGTIAASSSQFAIGDYNISDSNDTYPLIVGNGTSDTSRSNALTIDWNGRIQCGDYQGNLTSIFDLFYPVGSYYETSDSTFNPNTAWGGTWILETEGQVHVSSGTGYTVSGALTNTSDGGEATHVLTASETGIRNHTHTYSDYNTTYTLKTTNRKPGTSTAVAYGTGLTAGGGATTRTSNNPASEASGAAHNNMQPYIVVNRWHRTA